MDPKDTALRRWLDRAMGVALCGEGKHKLGAVCLSKTGRLMSTACNTYRTHPLQASYAKRVGLPKKQSLHAEMRALLAARGKVDTLIVARVNRKGELRLAKPCCICEEAIGEAGVNNIIYSVWNGWVVY